MSDLFIEVFGIVFVVLFGLWIIVAVLGVIADDTEQELLCKNNTPINYELIRSTTTFQDICYYETLSDIEYHECEIVFENSTNHGKVIVSNTCKGED